MKKLAGFSIVSAMLMAGALMSVPFISSAEGGIKPLTAPTPRRKVTPRPVATGQPPITTTVKGNNTSGYIGGTEDGQSIRRRQRNSHQQVTSPGQPPITGTVKGNKPAGYIGGTEDGSSIRRKQPRRRH